MSKSVILSSIVVVTALCAGTHAAAQPAQGAAPMSKDAAKGMYGGTYKLSNGNIAVFYQSPKGGVFAYEFDANARFLKEHQDEAAVNALFEQATTENTSQAHREAKEVSNVDVLFTTRKLGGGLQLKTANIYLNSDKKFVYGFEIAEKDKKKLKAEDTWKTLEIGSRAAVPENMQHLKFKAKNGRYLNFDFNKSESLVMAPAAGYIQTAGIIVEKVNIRNPSPYANNRLFIMKVGGQPYTEASNIHIMPYAMQPVGVGTSSKGNFIALTMPVQGFSTVKEQNKLYAPSEDRNKLYIFEIDSENKVVHETAFPSELRTVNYQALPLKNHTLLIGTGTGGKNWRMMYNGQKMTGLTLALLDEQGKVVSSKTYEDKELMSRSEVAGTGANKFHMKFTGGPDFYRAETLENGNVFVLGKSDGLHHGILLSADGTLIRYYLFESADLTKHREYGNRLEVKGNKIYFVKTDQPNALSNEVQSKTNSSSSTTYMGGGYALKTTTTTTRTSQRFEVFHISQLFTIDGTSGACSRVWLGDVIKGFHTLGDFPALFTDEGIYFPGRPKADKGREIGLVKFNY
jgi:hypothetical protein